VLLCAAMEFAKIDTDLRRVWGWAYVAKNADGSQVEDHSGDVVDSPEAIAALEDSFHRFVRDSREADDGHEVYGVGRLIEASFMSPAKAEMMGIPSEVPVGIFAGFEFDDDEAGLAAWEKVKSQESLMFSLVGEGVRP